MSLVYYSLSTGQRVTDRFGANNPSKVSAVDFQDKNIPIEFLERGQSYPISLDKARGAKMAMQQKEEFDKVGQNDPPSGGTQDQINTALGTSNAMSPVKNDPPSKPKKSVKKDAVHKSAKTGEFVSAEFADKHPATTYATKRPGSKVAKKTKK